MSRVCNMPCSRVLCRAVTLPEQPTSLRSLSYRERSSSGAPLAPSPRPPPAGPPPERPSSSPHSTGGGPPLNKKAEELP